MSNRLISLAVAAALLLGSYAPVYSFDFDRLDWRRQADTKSSLGDLTERNEDAAKTRSVETKLFGKQKTVRTSSGAELIVGPPRYDGALQLSGDRTRLTGVRVSDIKNPVLREQIVHALESTADKKGNLDPDVKASIGDILSTKGANVKVDMVVHNDTGQVERVERIVVKAPSDGGSNRLVSKVIAGQTSEVRDSLAEIKKVRIQKSDERAARTLTSFEKHTIGLAKNTGALRNTVMDVHVAGNNKTIVFYDKAEARKAAAQNTPVTDLKPVAVIRFNGAVATIEIQGGQKRVPRVAYKGYGKDGSMIYMSARSAVNLKEGQSLVMVATLSGASHGVASMIAVTNGGAVQNQNSLRHISGNDSTQTLSGALHAAQQGQTVLGAAQGFSRSKQGALIPNVRWSAVGSINPMTARPKTLLASASQSVPSSGFTGGLIANPAQPAADAQLPTYRVIVRRNSKNVGSTFESRHVLIDPAETRKGLVALRFFDPVRKKPAQIWATVRKGGKAITTTERIPDGVFNFKLFRRGVKTRRLEGVSNLFNLTGYQIARP